MLALRALPLLAVAVLGLASCGDEAESRATVEDVCETIFELCDDHYGWESLESCEDGFIGDIELGTTCADEDGYFSCVEDCLDAEDCDSFRECEASCWDGNCND